MENTTDIKSKVDVTFWGLVILAVIVGALIFFGFFSLITGKSLEGIGVIITALISMASLLLGYFWGSSSGSKEKTKLLEAKDAGNVTNVG